VVLIFTLGSTSVLESLLSLSFVLKKLLFVSNVFFLPKLLLFIDSYYVERLSLVLAMILSGFNF